MKESGYSGRDLLVNCLVVIVGWGLVPTLVQTADFPVGAIAFWVNVFSAIGVLGVLVVKGYLPQLVAFHLYPRFIGMSLVWPMAYSLCYFSIIKVSDSGSLATLFNYLWPIFALLMLAATRKMRIPLVGIVFVVGFSAAVAVVMWLEGNVVLSGLMLLLGFITPFTQAFFNVFTSDETKYPGEYAWLLTLIGAVVTAIGSAVYIFALEGGDFLHGAEVTELWPLMAIGLGGNTFGFFAFLRAGQLSRTPEAKIWFILSMFLVPFAQVIFLFIGVERNINPWRLVGIAIVAFGLLTFKLWENHHHRQQA